MHQHPLIPALKSFRRLEKASKAEQDRIFAKMTELNVISKIIQEYILIQDKQSTLPSQYRNQVVFIVKTLELPTNKEA